MPRRRRVGFHAAIACVVAMVGVRAAPAQQLPGPAEPGQILRQFEPPPVPHAQEEPIIAPTAVPGKPPANADQIKFFLTGFVIDGATVYAPTAFLPLYEKLQGTEITLRQVFDVADAITAKYRQDGYVLTLAVVPAQQITAGIVRLTVIEGFIDKIIIDDTLGKRGSLILEMAAKIAAARPLDSKTLERYVLLINDLPGLTARAILKPSDTPGAADLILTLEEKPVDAYASLDNRGSRFVGPVQTSFGVNANSILGYNERTAVRTTITAQTTELKFFDVTHGVPLTAEGTRGQIQVSKSYANPGYTLEPIDVHSEATTVAVEASHPIVRSRSENLSANARFDMRWIEADQGGGANRISKDIIRALRLRADYDFVDTVIAPAVSLVSFEISQGLDILGARESGSPDLSRPNGRSDFTKLNLNTQRLQALGGGFSLLAAASGQYAFSTLLAADEFGFGGPQFGRGYDPAELTGDHGLAGKLEISYGSETKLPWLPSYQVYGFYDAGAVWNRDHAPDENGYQSATSAGLGVRANLSPHFSANVELGMPLTGRVAARGEKGEDARIFFGLVGRY